MIFYGNYVGGMLAWTLYLKREFVEYKFCESKRWREYKLIYPAVHSYKMMLRSFKNDISKGMIAVSQRVEIFQE